ncbi:MAG: hypothetical protein RRA92_00120 [Gemmatimonadota bacterium]|nr:hypothetical protein [Gemmatimonadota bacterium]
MARLETMRRLALSGPDPETRRRRADSARAAVLADAGVTPEALLEFAHVAGGDPARMQALAERITARVDSLRALPAEEEVAANGREPDADDDAREGAVAESPAEGEPATGEARERPASGRASPSSDAARPVLPRPRARDSLRRALRERKPPPP